LPTSPRRWNGEAKRTLAASQNFTATRKTLDQENRKLQNLLTALEGGATAPASVLKAIAEREKTIAQLEGQLQAAADRPKRIDVADLSTWVERQLADLHSLLKEDVPRVKAEFRRLNLALSFQPVEAKPRAHYVVKGQCDLSALAFSFVRAGDRVIERSVGRSSTLGAVVDHSGEQAGV
jgi:DNA repair exonuclease SbcCD ATPase subunit